MSAIKLCPRCGQDTTDPEDDPEAWNRLATPDPERVTGMTAELEQKEVEV